MLIFFWLNGSGAVADTHHLRAGPPTYSGTKRLTPQMLKRMEQRAAAEAKRKWEEEAAAWLLLD